MGNKIKLLELLKQDNIQSRIVATNWEEVVDVAGDMLVKQRGVADNYVKAMKDSIRKNGPYVVIADGFALLHARPENGVIRLCMSLVTLENPVYFGNKDHDPVKVAIAFGAVDSDQHLEALRELMKVLMHDNAIEAMGACKTSQEIFDYVSSILLN